MKIKLKINKISNITNSVNIEDDFIITKKGNFYLIKNQENIIPFDPNLILFNEKDKTTSFIINFIKGYDIDMYNKFKYFK